MIIFRFVVTIVGTCSEHWAEWIEVSRWEEYETETSRGIKLDICNTGTLQKHHRLLLPPAFCLLNNNNLTWSNGAPPPPPHTNWTPVNYFRNINRFHRYCDLARDTHWTSFSLQINWLSLSLGPKQTLFPYWNPYLSLGLHHDLVKLSVIRKMKSLVSYSISPHSFPARRRKRDIDVAVVWMWCGVVWGMKITLMWSQVS